MIDRIVRRSYNEYVIIYTHRPPVTVSSSGNAKALLEFLLYGKFPNSDNDTTVETQMAS
jgi:hypothetical protein